VAFGGLSSVEDACRDARGVSLVTDALRDLRYAWRGLVRNPLFAICVTGSLVLGIGVNATMFTLMRAALWRPLPVPAPEEIVHVRRTADMAFSYVLFHDLKKASAGQAIVVAKTTARQRKFGLDPASRERVTARRNNTTSSGDAGRCGCGTHARARRRPAIGRQAEEVLSHAFWTRRSAPTPASSASIYQESPFTVVGVAEGFTGVSRDPSIPGAGHRRSAITRTGSLVGYHGSRSRADAGPLGVRPPRTVGASGRTWKQSFRRFRPVQEQSTNNICCGPRLRTGDHRPADSPLNC
jgi:hypothetical protein